MLHSVFKNIDVTTFCMITMLVIGGCGPRNFSSSPDNPTISPYLKFNPTITIETDQSQSPFPPTKTNTQPPSQTPSSTPKPSMTATSTLTPSPIISPTSTPTDTPTPLGYIPENAILIYFSLLGENYPDQCQYVLVALSVGRLRTGDLEQDISAGLNSLFTAGQYSGKLYNATYTSNLHTDSVDVNKSSGKVTITLSGTYVKPANACDAQQYKNQVWTTVRQFPEVAQIGISLDNGKLLGDLLAVYSDR